MPRNKQRKSGENKKKLNSASTTTKAGLDDKEKRLYLIQIGCLNEELERFQIKCHELQKQNNILISQCVDKKDITAYLKHSLSEKEGELAELREQLEEERHSSVQEKRSLLLEQGQLRQELQARIDKLEEKNVALAEKLCDLEEFQRQKDGLMADMENLEKQLQRQKEEHKDEIRNLEMKSQLEKRRLEEELEREVAAMSAQVQHLVEQKLPEATRSVLQENLELQSLLGRLSAVSRSLQRENAALRERKKQLSVDTDVLEETLRRAARASCMRQKDVQQLTGQFQRLQQDDREKQQQLERIRAEQAQVLADMEALRLDRAALSAEWSRSRSERNQLQVKLAEEKRRRSRMKSILQQAANALRQALKEAPAEQQEEGGAPQWRRLLQNLQEVLDRQTGSCSSAERLSGSQASPRAGSFQSQPSCHRTLDFCLVSRPGPKPRGALCRSGAASCSSLLPLHRRPTIQKSSSSVNFSCSSVGFLTSKQPNGQNLPQKNLKITRKYLITTEKYI
ncbi:cilia- and flagella-associated protein 157-like [Poeciliopsis prolifica]|uniref:cilia- and flagella-associated protein 157-like n=1 Tax=Poeciliopsis prolifica TaxID=188132 RepID=UPI002412E93C|nr:cilia- and flagella-associated protein 157-like [Poeciliopsis prolifica]